MKKKIIIIGSVVLTILIIGVVIFVLLKSEKQTKDQIFKDATKEYYEKHMSGIKTIDEVEITLGTEFYISTINFEFSSVTYSPAIAFHWTYYKIKSPKTSYALRGNYTLNGNDLCSYTNPCLKGYTCVGGLCEKCHASCFDCKNGGLTTDCDTKCSTHSTQPYPDRGSCTLGYL